MMDYFKYEEFIESDVAQTNGIDNTPDENAKENILELAGIMDRIRGDWTVYCDKMSYGNPALTICSAYRCPELNKKVGGVSKSAHQTGSACDVQPSNGRVNEFFLFMQTWLLAKDVPFDELLFERNKKTKWVHFANKSWSGEYRYKVGEIIS